MFPDNLVKACFTQVKTIYTPVEAVEIENATQNIENVTSQAPTKFIKVLQDNDGMNVLGETKVLSRLLRKIKLP